MDIMKRRNLIIANWKMNPESLEEAKRIFNTTKKVAALNKNTDVVVCPPFVYLESLSKSKPVKNLFLGAQNIASETKGAFTGEISAEIVKNSGASYTTVGHSERRLMGETNQIVKKKLQIAFDTGLTPILCIGEKERDKEGTYLEFIKNQIKECLSGLQKKYLVGLILAYEPVWAIGKSYKEAMSPTDVHEMVLFIRKVVGELFGKDIVLSLRILYGAAVEPENTALLFEHGNIDGLLVGHASITTQFGDILKSVPR